MPKHHLPIAAKTTMREPNIRDDSSQNSCDDDVIAKIMIDPHLANYKDILSSAWCKQFCGSLKAAPEIEDAGLRLVFQWRAISGVADFPSAAMHIFSSFAESVIRHQPIAGVAEPLADSFASAMQTRAPKLARQSLFKGALRHAAADTKKKLESALGAASSTVTPEQAWNAFREEKAFRFRVWASLQTASVAAFNAYESFLTEPLPPRVGREGFDDRAKAHYGVTLYQRLLHTNVIDVVRQLRHAISHNQGRATEKLNALNHGLATHDGLISVFPGDLRKFIQAMGTAAEELVAAKGTESQSTSSADP